MIPRFHDERDEKAMSFFAGLAVNTLFEQLSAQAGEHGRADLDHAGLFVELASRNGLR